MPALDRGSGRRPRRPRIATAATATGRWCGGWQRPPSAAAEDRNLRVEYPNDYPTWQRPPSAAAQDRNLFAGYVEQFRGWGSGRRPRRPRIATRRRG